MANFGLLSLRARLRGQTQGDPPSRSADFHRFSLIWVLQNKACEWLFQSIPALKGKIWQSKPFSVHSDPFDLDKKKENVGNKRPTLRRTRFRFDTGEGC